MLEKINNIRENGEKELNDLGIFQENQNAIKIIEWPNLIKIPMTSL